MNQSTFTNRQKERIVKHQLLNVTNNNLSKCCNKVSSVDVDTIVNSVVQLLDSSFLFKYAKLLYINLRVLDNDLYRNFVIRTYCRETYLSNRNVLVLGRTERCCVPKLSLYR